MRSIMSYLTSLTSKSIRDKLSRLKDVLLILNLDSVSESPEFYGSSNMTLTPTEVRSLLRLRNDFDRSEIRRLKL